MADKIDQLKIKNAQGTDVFYDIDLPVDATPSIASLTTTGNVTVGGSLKKNNLTFTLPSSSGTLTLDENLPVVSFGTDPITGATEIKSISVGNNDYNLGGGGEGTVTSVSAGTGLSISGTPTINPTVNIAEGYKLLTTTDWKNDSVYSVMNASSVAGSTTSGAVLSVRWYVSGVNGITTPYDGMKIAIKIPRAGVSTGGALLSINGNTDANYHPVAYNVNTVFTSHYAVNTIKYLTYDATATMTGYVSAGTATTITGVWKFDADYDSNTTITYGTLAYYYRPYMAAYLSPYQLVVVDKDNRLVPLSTTQFPAYSSSTTYAKDVYVYYSNVIYKSLQASNKNHTPNSSTTWWAAQTTPHTPTTAAFRPDKIYWYNTTTAISAGSAIGGNTLMSVGYNQPNMAICNFNSTITSYRMIYLRGTYNRTTGLFTLKSGGTAGTTNYYTLVPDKTANITLSSYFTSGDDYILIGASYSSNNYLHLREDHPMFHFDGTNLVPYDTYNENRIEGLIPSSYVASSSYNSSTKVLTITPNSGSATTVTFGSNAFNSTTIPTSYISSASYNSSTKKLTITPNSGSATEVTFGSNAFTSTTIPTTYVSTVNGSSGAITNVAKTNSDNSFSTVQTFSTNGIKLAQATGSTNYYATIKGDNSVSSNITLTLPSTAGTLALTSQIPSTSNFVTTDASQNITGSKTWLSAQGSYPQTQVSTTGVMVYDYGSAMCVTSLQKNQLSITASSGNKTTYKEGAIDVYDDTPEVTYTLTLPKYNSTLLGIASTKAAGQFYSGTTAPTNTTRLNYDGYLYAKALYSNGSLVLSSHRDIKVNTSATMNNSTAVNFIAGTGITLSANIGTTTNTITISSSGGASNIKYQTGYVSLEDYVYFQYGGSGKIIISGEQGVYAGWNFNLECNTTYCVGGCVYAEMIISDNDVVCINYCSEDGTWYNEIWTSSWDSLDTWRISTYIGYGTLNLTYIGNFTTL